MQICTLVVDDQSDIRLLIKTIIDLANEGLFVGGEAASGEEAIERVDALDPAVIVLDEMMPGMDGIEAAQTILARRPGQPIILCSAYLDDEIVARAQEAGIKICLPKTEVHTLPEKLRQLNSANRPA